MAGSVACLLKRLVKVTEGSNFGWPYAYYDQMIGKNVLQPGYGGDGKITGTCRFI